MEQLTRFKVTSPPLTSLPRYRVGETFVLVPFSRAKKLLSADQESKTKEIDDIRARLDDNAEEMRKLKVLLYGKFGSQINLD